MNLPVIEEGRACGTCTACCTTMAVPELGKPAGERCRHVIPGRGCGIYEDRPESCREFVCTWLQGAGRGVSARPDRTRIVAHTADGVDGFVLHGRERDVFRPSPGAGGYWRRLIDRLLRHRSEPAFFLVSGDRKAVLTRNPQVLAVFRKEGRETFVKPEQLGRSKQRS